MGNIESKIIEVIDRNSDRIIEFGDHIWHNAELGYKEFETSKYFYDLCKELGLKTKDNLAITGVKSYLREIDPNLPTIAIIGELDGLPFPEHLDANPKTKAAHCCGHNAQMAGMMGAMIALSNEEIKNNIEGNIIFFAVPAEEFVDIEYRNDLIKQGKIKYGGGKSELIRIGEFEEIDIAIGHHMEPECELAISNSPTTGFVNKVVKFHGISSHAAGAPEKGANALNAAVLALNALDQQREKFRDGDSVNVHGMISNGGQALNIIADYVSMQYAVRANKTDTIMEVSNLFDRSMRAGAIGNGCGVEIMNMPGYLPVIPSPDITALEEAIDIVSKNKYEVKVFDHTMQKGLSTDFGDVSSIMPLLQFNTGGYSGDLHDVDLKVIDKNLAYVETAKLFALTAYNLLKDKNKKAKSLIQEYKPLFTKEQYLNYMEKFNSVKTIEME